MLKTMLLIATIAGAIAGAAATAATATEPQVLTFTTDGSLTGPSSAAGAWRATGVFDGAGTYTEEFRFAGGSMHAIKTLTSLTGTIVLKVQTLYSIAPDGTVTFSEGSWKVIDTTGAYAGLHANGQPAVSADSFGSLATGQIHVVHPGTGHFE
jgi:hypothetical protein